MGYAISEQQVPVKRITPHCDPEPKIAKVHDDLFISHPDTLDMDLPPVEVERALPPPPTRTNTLDIKLPPVEVERALPPPPTRTTVAVSPPPRSFAPAPVRLQPKLSGPLDLSTIDNATKPIDRTLSIRFTNVGEWEVKLCNTQSQGEKVPKWRLVTEVTQTNRSAHLTYWLPADKDHTSYMPRSPRLYDIAKVTIIQSMTLQAPRFSQLHSVAFHCDEKTKTVFVDDVAIHKACPFGFDSLPNPMLTSGSQSPSIPMRSASVAEELDASMFNM